jgi:hypothetical protein
MVKNVLLVNDLLLRLFLSDTYGGRVHDSRIATDRIRWLPMISSG